MASLIPFDSVVTSAHDPRRCGVSRFSHELAHRLHLPVYTTAGLTPSRAPLVSIKPSEMRLHEWHALQDAMPARWWMFLHELPPESWYDWLGTAQAVWTGNEVIARTLLTHGLRDVRPAWCPSPYDIQPVAADVHRPVGPGAGGVLWIVTFGIAGRIESLCFERLAHLLEVNDVAFRLTCHTLRHDDDEQGDAVVWGQRERLCRILGRENLTFKGERPDDELLADLSAADLIAVFYQPAARSGNTTLWTALQTGRPVITNLDRDSPMELTEPRALDVWRLTGWPRDWAPAKHTWAHRGWASLIQTLCA